MKIKLHLTNNVPMTENKNTIFLFTLYNCFNFYYRDFKNIDSFEHERYSLLNETIYKRLKQLTDN